MLKKNKLKKKMYYKHQGSRTQRGKANEKREGIKTDGI